MSDIWIRRRRFGRAQCSIAEAASARNISSNISACTAYYRGFITDERSRTNIGPDLPYGFLGFSPGPRGFKAPPAKSSQSKIDDTRKNRGDTTDSLELKATIAQVGNVAGNVNLLPLFWNQKDQYSSKISRIAVTVAAQVFIALKQPVVSKIQKPEWPSCWFSRRRGSGKDNCHQSYGYIHNRWLNVLSKARRQ
ncbi:hypothetical protein EVAR_43825_1 [Eumeta japonica]|uniref:Uncharacterized protein n=1 Tax=Eumeta variegata TaxID=151549 RepID=A0A4C1WYR2_EUMVA|nr:hypothetical protein EVAR_43825_1 [Eumeta japonica]